MSIEYKLNYLKQTWVSVLQSTVDRNSFKVFIDFLSAVSEGLGSIISNLGLLKTAIIGIGTVLGTKKLGILSKYDGRYTLFGKHRKADVVDSGTAGFLSTLNSNDVKNLSEADLTARMEAWNNLGNTVNPNVSKFFAEIKSGKRVLAEGQTLLDAFKNSIYNIKKAFDLSGLSLKDFFKNLGSAIKKLGSTLLSGIKAVSVKLLDAVASMGLSYIAAEITSWIFDGIMSLFKDRTQEIIDAGKEAADKANEVISSYENQSKTVSNLRDRYAELAQGVKDLGMATQSQGKLSTDDYAEFLDISNQLAGVFPELKTGITDEGDVLLSLNGNAETISSTLDGLLEREQKLAAIDIQKQMPDVWSGFGAEVSDISDDYNDAYNKLSRYKQAYDSLKDAVKNNSYANWGELTTYEGYSDEIRSIIEENGLDFDEYLEKSFSSVEFQNLFDSVFNKYQKDVDFFGNQIKSENRKIASYITSLFSSDSEYTNLTSASKSLIDKLVNSIHFDTEYYDERVAGDWDAVYENVKKRSLDVIAKLEADSPELADKFNTAYSEIINYRQSDKTVDQLLDQWNFIRETINNLQISDEDKQLFLDALPSDQDIIDKLDHIKAIMGEHWSDDLQSEFTAADLEVLAKIKLDEDSLSYTLEQIKKYISDATVEPQTKAHDTVKAVEKLRKAVSGLNDLMDKLNDQNFDITSIDSSTLSSIDSAFSDFIQSKKKDGEEVETLTNAYEKFQRVLVQQPGDTEAAKAAVNDLITAYIDQTDIIKGLDESTKQWAIDQLKDMKIKNAEEVINNRLNETNRNALEQTKKMSDAWGEYGDALEQGVENSDSYRTGIKELGDAFAGMFTVIDENGNQVKPVISKDFVKENLDLIKRISAGDTDALNELLDKYEEVYGEIADKPILIKVEYGDTLDHITGKAYQAVDSMAELESAMNSLPDLYQQVIKALDDSDGKGTFGFADPATINSVESAFSKFIDTVDDADTKQKLSYVLQDFENTLVKFPGDADKAQDAMNDLITAYIDQTDLIKNLTEENKEWTIAKLKDFGVTNAEEVVTTRLNKANKKLLEGEKKLTKIFAENADVLEGTQSITNENKSAIEQLTTAVQEMFTVETENGNIVPDIDTSFVVQNLELIQQAAAGDVDAINQLRHALASDIVSKVHVESDVAKEIDIVRNDINDLINSVDLDSLEIGATFDNTGVIDGLNKWVQAGKITQESMNKILSGIGVTPKIDYEEVEFNATNWAALVKNNSAYEGAAGAEAYKGMQQIGKITIPKISYVVGSDVAKANYVPPASTGGSQGSDGSTGSDSKTNEDTEETFDWIEVAIQRIEEEIARLDKTVNNTYTTWGKRNKALKDEFKDIEREIEIQQHAYERYLANANEVKVTGSPNIDDYSGADDKQYKYDVDQYTEAYKLWETGEYQKKIREGLIGQGDIEKIQNKYLVQAINDYSELYNKAVAANDKVQDLQINLGDKMKQNFDFIKTRYEGILGVFEKSQSVLDERISRTQEHGYFVAAKYYENQLKYEQQTHDKLVDQLAELKQAREDAVSSGAIKKGSEEFVNMGLEIMEVESAIEQSTTAMVKFNKEIEKLSIDGFTWVMDRLDKITSETEFLVDLMDEYKSVTDEGYWNERGWGKAGMYAINYDVYMKKADEYGKKVAEWQAKLAKDPNNKDYREQLESWNDAWQEMIKNAKQAKEAIRDLVSEAFQTHLSYLQELIDKVRTSLNDSKDLYNYQKSIAQQTKNIGEIEKQIAAYSGDNSEEARATIQKLQKSLEDAQTGLKETEWDRYISETETLLDNMYEDYEDFLNDRLEQIDDLFEDVIKGVNENRDAVQSIAQAVADKWGYDITDYTEQLIADDATANPLSTKQYQNSVMTDISSIVKILERITTGNGIYAYIQKEGGYSGYGKYATGSSHIPHSQLAWTQENGSELIYRKSDGAMLTPLNAGDMVFTNDMTKALWNMAKNPALTGMNVTVPSTTAARTVNNDNDITIVLPNVTNYDEFKTALQKDPKFTNFIQATTLGQSLGKGKLNRGNY